MPTIAALKLRKVPDDKGGIARFLSHLDEPNLKPVITDQSVSFSALASLGTVPEIFQSHLEFKQ